MSEPCTTIGCENPGAITGMFYEGEQAFPDTTYCRECADAIGDVFVPQPAAVPTGERPCMCGRPPGHSVHTRPQVSEEEHAYEPAPTEAEFYGAGPTGEGRAEVREQVAAELERFVGIGTFRAWELADAVLAVPAIREALAAAEKLRRAEELADGYALMGEVLHDVPRAETYRDVAADLRRALAGRDGDRQEGEGQ